MVSLWMGKDKCESVWLERWGKDELVGKSNMGKVIISGYRLGI